MKTEYNMRRLLFQILNWWPKTYFNMEF